MWSLAFWKPREVLPGGAVVGFQLQRAPQMRRRIVKPSGFGQRSAKVAVRFRGVWREIDGALQMRERLSEPTVREQERAQFLMSLRKRVVHRNRACEPIGGVRGAAGRGEGLADVELQVCISWRERRGHPEVQDGFLGAASRQ